MLILDKKSSYVVFHLFFPVIGQNLMRGEEIENDHRLISHQKNKKTNQITSHKSVQHEINW